MIDPRLFHLDQSEFPDGFVAGHYAWRRRDRVDLPVWVVFQPPADPIDGTPLDRAARWQVWLDGKILDEERFPRISDIWPRCLSTPVDEEEYLFLRKRIAHARAHLPNDPFGDVHGRIDLMTADTPF